MRLEAEVQDAAGRLEKREQGERAMEAEQSKAEEQAAMVLEAADVARAAADCQVVSTTTLLKVKEGQRQTLKERLQEAQHEQGLSRRVLEGKVTLLRAATEEAATLAAALDQETRCQCALL